MIDALVNAELSLPESRADPLWQPRTAEEAESIFAQICLTGEFWKLRAP